MAAVRDRPEIIVTNGNYHTYHVGAYLGDGLHEGAITSAIRVAELIANATQVKNEGMISIVKKDLLKISRSEGLLARFEAGNHCM